MQPGSHLSELLYSRPRSTAVPDGRETAGAVLPEQPVDAAVEVGVPGPSAQPVGGFLGRAGRVAGPEAGPVTVGVVEPDAGHVGEGGRKAAVVTGHLVHGRTAPATPRPVPTYGKRPGRTAKPLMSEGACAA